MISRPDTPRAGPAYVPCVIAGRGHAGGTQRSCPCCIDAAVKGVASKVITPKVKGSGHDAEQGLARQLEIAGYIDIVDVKVTPTSDIDPDDVFVRGFAFGLYLDPVRKYQADFAFPAHRLLVEVDGGAHYATKRQGQHDTERRGLAASIGWTICPVTPEQVRDGSAVEVVRRSIETRTA